MMRRVAYVGIALISLGVLGIFLSNLVNPFIFFELFVVMLLMICLGIGFLLYGFIDEITEWLSKN